MERYIGNCIDNLVVYRDNLMKIVKYRQQVLQKLITKHHRKMSSKLLEISSQMIAKHVDQGNFNAIEIEIDGFHSLIDIEEQFDLKVSADFNKQLSLSEQEFNNILSAYQSIYGTMTRRLNHGPGRSMIKVFSIKELELRY